MQWLTNVGELLTQDPGEPDIMRILGLDLGMKRIGVAVSDPTGTIAGPLPTVRRRASKRPPVAKLVAIGEEHAVEAVVVGLPLDPSGNESEWTAEVRRIGDEIGKRLSVPTHYIDERFTSARAERAIRSLGLPKSKREDKGRIDAASAILILQAWLDQRS